MQGEIIMEIISLIIGIIGLFVGALGLFKWRIDIKRNYTWNDIIKAIKKLEADIKEYNPNVIIGLSNGLLAAAIIALNYRIQILYWIDSPVLFNEKAERTTNISCEIGDITNKKVLIVDDQLYIGKNIKDTIDILKKQSPQEIKTLVLFKHTSRNALITPDYYAYEKDANDVRKVPWGFTAEFKAAYFKGTPIFK